MTCANCSRWRFVRQGNAKRAGECRRHAPGPATGGGAVVEAQWPITLEDDVCGDFMPKGEAAMPADPSEVPVTDPDRELVTDVVNTVGRVPRQTTQGGKRRHKR